MFVKSADKLPFLLLSLTLPLVVPREFRVWEKGLDKLYVESVINEILGVFLAIIVEVRDGEECVVRGAQWGKVIPVFHPVTPLYACLVIELKGDLLVGVVGYVVTETQGDTPSYGELEFGIVLSSHETHPQRQMSTCRKNRQIDRYI